MAAKKLSVIILTYNSESDIDKCLHFVYQNNDLNDELEIIIVDNNSVKQVELRNHIENEYPEVIYIQNTSNTGYGSGNNIGIRASKADYVVIMNPDVRLRKFSFKAIYQQYIENDKLGILGFMQYESMHKKGSSFVMLKPSITSFLLSKFYYRTNLFNPDLYCFHGSCFSFRKASFDAVGFFDESIFLYGEERYLHIYLTQKREYYASMDRNQSYIHPMHGRVAQPNQAEFGLQSYLYTINKFKLSKSSALKAQIRFEKLFLYKSLLFGRKVQAEFHRNKIKRLNEVLAD